MYSFSRAQLAEEAPCNFYDHLKVLDHTSDSAALVRISQRLQAVPY